MSGQSTYTAAELDAKLLALQDRLSDVVSPFGDIEGEAERSERKRRSMKDFAFFKSTYFPHYARQAEPEFARQLQRVCEERNKPQLLLGFRGCGKSTDVSLIYTLWEIVRQSAYFYIFVSRSADIAIAEYALPLLAEIRANRRLANDFNLGVQFLASDSQEQKKQSDFVVNDVRVMAMGLRQGFRGKKHRGRRPDRVRIEDVEDNNNRFTPALIKKYRRVIEDDLMQSLGMGSDEEWSVVYLSNYFSKRSLVHTLRVGGLFEITTIKALRPVKKGERRADAVNGWVSTWPERYSTAMLMDLWEKAPSTFLTEWQQEPQDEDSPLRREWFRYFKSSDLPDFHDTNSMRLAWVDPSPGEKDTSDFKAYGVADCILTADGELHLYLRDARVRRETVNTMIEGMFEMDARWEGTVMWGYEEVASEFYLLKTVERDSVRYGRMLNLFPVMKEMPGFAYKKDRIPRLQGPLERGYIHVLAGDTDQDLVIVHCTEWPDGLNDDGADLLSGLYRLAEMMLLGAGSNEQPTSTEEKA